MVGETSRVRLDGRLQSERTSEMYLEHLNRILRYSSPCFGTECLDFGLDGTRCGYRGVHFSNSCPNEIFLESLTGRLIIRDSMASGSENTSYELFAPNGDHYKGTLFSGQFHGRGMINYCSGERYSGMWKNGKRHGPGRHRDIEGNETARCYKDGLCLERFFYLQICTGDYTTLAHTLELLLKSEVDFERLQVELGERGQAPLHFAVEWDHRETLSLLLKYPFPLNYFRSPKSIHSSQLPCTLMQGCEVPTKVSMSGTPLYGAALLGRREITELLLEGGADSNVLSDGLKTPLHAAAKRGDVEMIRLLLTKGRCDPSLGSPDLVEYCESCDQVEAAKILRSERNWQRRKHFIMAVYTICDSIKIHPQSTKNIEPLTFAVFATELAFGSQGVFRNIISFV